MAFSQKDTDVCSNMPVWSHNESQTGMSVAFSHHSFSAFFFLCLGDRPLSLMSGYFLHQARGGKKREKSENFFPATPFWLHLVQHPNSSWAFYRHLLLAATWQHPTFWPLRCNYFVPQTQGALMFGCFSHLDCPLLSCSHQWSYY